MTQKKKNTSRVQYLYEAGSIGALDRLDCYSVHATAGYVPDAETSVNKRVIVTQVDDTPATLLAENRAS